MQVLLECCYIWKVHNEKMKIISFVVMFVLNRPSLSISRCRSRYDFVISHSDSTKTFSETDINIMLEFLIDNIFGMVGEPVFQQTVGIPMSTNCAPLLAELFLYSYEADFIQGFLNKNEKKLARSFNFTFRYIDDVLSLNNSRFGDSVSVEKQVHQPYQICCQSKTRAWCWYQSQKTFW
jgi:hypothetical protein